MIYNAIKNFHVQFDYAPVVENRERLKTYEKYIVAGMGGSHLAADCIKTWNPYAPVQVFSDYNLPPLSDKELSESLLIANSYSGNTEEVVDFFNQAVERRFPLAAVSVGGKLLQLAKDVKIPYVCMPDTGIQPRLALGYNILALLALMKNENGLREAARLANELDASEFESAGAALAERLRGYVPIVYSSAQNIAIAYNWKIKFNETGKIPAFYNVLPELNHNEMTGFDVKDSTKKLSDNMFFLILSDSDDNPRILKRMEMLEKLYGDRGLPVETIMLEKEGGGLYKIFSSLILADWTAYYTAKQYGTEPEQVPMVEEFKHLIQI
ncbi:MAG: hypothetical protein HYZ69_01545 [Candidatus Colwellbacteria bacterium]|nr:hypothetical protein [Candidatus Colwellbacteria bacterium]